jgi:uncharacterized protein YeaO (DUF488 family)
VGVGGALSLENLRETHSPLRAELDARKEAWRPILESARRGKVTLLYSARDRQHNSAAALKTYLESHLNI